MNCSFYIFIIINNVSVTSNVQVCVDMYFHSSGYITRSGNGVSHGNSIFNILKNGELFSKFLHRFVFQPTV